jgi:HECT-domain (ubiquitin-transferase)
VYRYFVGTERITAEDVLSAMTFETLSADGEVLPTIPPSDAFISVFTNAIELLEFSELRQLVKFVTSSPAIRRGASKLHIIAKAYTPETKSDPTSDADARTQFKDILKGWPSYPLPRAATCFSQLFVPYFDNEDASRCGMSARWDADSVLAMLRSMLAYKAEEFSDE